jgi:large subunit ribosomal protein L17
MFRNMVTSLFKHDCIRTTDVKAKELRRWADHIVTLAKRGDLHARRQAMAIIREKDVVHKLFEEAGNRFGTISGGYTRIVKIGYRPGDAAPISLIELVGAENKEKSGKKKTKPAAKKKAKSVATEKVDAKKDQAEKEEPSNAAEAAEEKAVQSGKKASTVQADTDTSVDADEKPEENETIKTAENDTDEPAGVSASKGEPSEPEEPEKQD